MTAHLRIVQETGETAGVCQCDALSTQVENLKTENDALSKELAVKVGAISKLKKQVHEDLDLHPQVAAARRVYQHWRERCHPQAHKKCPRDRLQLILDRMEGAPDKGFTEEQCIRAVDGAAEHPFVDDRGKRHDSIELIFRNTGKTQDFIERVEPRGPAPQSAPVQPIRVGAVGEDASGAVNAPGRPYERITWTLARHFGVEALDWRESYWSDGPDGKPVLQPPVVDAPCPLHPDDPLRSRPLTIMDEFRGSPLALICAKGCEWGDIWTAIDQLEQRYVDERARSAAATEVMRKAWSAALLAAEKDVQAMLERAQAALDAGDPRGLQAQAVLFGEAA